MYYNLLIIVRHLGDDLSLTKHFQKVLNTVCVKKEFFKSVFRISQICVIVSVFHLLINNNINISKHSIIIRSKCTKRSIVKHGNARLFKIEEETKPNCLEMLRS